MRKFELAGGAALGSLAVHAGLVLAVVAWGGTASRRTPPTPAAAPVEISVAWVAPAEPAPLEVVLLPDDSPALAVAPTSATSATPATPPTSGPPATATRAPRVAVSRSTPGSGDVNVSIDGPGAGSGDRPATGRRGMLSMRGSAEGPALVASGDVLERIAAGGKPYDPGPAPSGQLEAAGAGRMRSNQGTFSLDVARDGAVTSRDAPNARAGITLPGPRAIGRGVTDWYRSDKGEDGKRGDRTLEKHLMEPIPTGDPTVIVGVAGGSFDLGDAVMRGRGMDPYAARKLRALDATRDERVAIGQRHRAAQLRGVHALIRDNLAAMWRATPDPAARRRALFEMWDEAGEPRAEGEADAVETAGAAARAQVVAWIRSHLPAGSPAAYTAAELAALNARRQSRATFAPYE